MGLAVVHAVQHDRIDRRAVECENADDTAHGCSNPQAAGGRAAVSCRAADHRAARFTASR